MSAAKRAKRSTRASPHHPQHTLSSPSHPSHTLRFSIASSPHMCARPPPPPPPPPLSAATAAAATTDAGRRVEESLAWLQPQVRQRAATAAEARKARSASLLSLGHRRSLGRRLPLCPAAHALPAHRARSRLCAAAPCAPLPLCGARFRIALGAAPLSRVVVVVLSSLPCPLVALPSLPPRAGRGTALARPLSSPWPRLSRPSPSRIALRSLRSLLFRSSRSPTLASSAALASAVSPTTSR